MFLYIHSTNPEALCLQPFYEVSTDEAASAVNEYSFHEKVPIKTKFGDSFRCCAQYTGAMQLLRRSRVIPGTSIGYCDNIARRCDFDYRKLSAFKHVLMVQKSRRIS